MAEFPWDALWYIVCFGIGALLIACAPGILAGIIGLLISLIRNIFSKGDD